MYSTEQSLKILKKKTTSFPEMLMVLGSGWNKVLDVVKPEVEIGYEELFGVQASVPGHEGKLVVGKLGGKRVAFMAGRFHTYEGYTTEEVTRPIQVFSQLGMKSIVVTSAAGALNEKYKVGDFVVLSDVITLFCQSPLSGPSFIDLSECFDAKLRSKSLNFCATNGIPFHEGVYVYTKGPHFETPADKMMARQLGADAIGMSTVPETLMARSLNVQVLGISFVTNLAFVQHAHADVLAAANEGSSRMVALLKGILQ